MVGSNGEIKAAGQQHDGAQTNYPLDAAAWPARWAAALGRAAARAAALSDEDRIVDAVNDELRRVGVRLCWLWLDGAGGELRVAHRPAADDGPDAAHCAEQHIQVAAGPFEPILAAQQAFLRPGCDETTAALLPGVPAGQAGQTVYLPLLSGGRMLGLIVAWGSELSPPDLPVLSVLAAQLAAAIDNTRLRAVGQAQQSAALPISQMLKTLVENQGEGIGLVDREERFTFANPAAERIFGVPPGTLVGRSLTCFLDPAQEAVLWAQVARRKRLERGTYELEIVRPDGEKRFLLVTATPHADGQGEYAGAFGIFRDMTERIGIEQALHKARDELELRVDERTHDLRQANQRLQVEIAERRRAEENLQKRNRELALLNRSIQAFGSTLDVRQVMALILDEVRHLLNISACSVWLLDTAQNELVCQESAGLQRQAVRGWRLPYGQGVAGWVAETGQPLNVCETRGEQRHFKQIDHLLDLEIRSILAVPLQVKGRAIGVLEMLDERPGRFDESDEMLVELLAASAADAIENAQLYERLDQARQQWEKIFQAIGHPTLILDGAHRIIAANQSMVRVSGRPEADLVGARCYQVMHGSMQPSTGCPLCGMLASAQPQTVEIEMEALGGTFLVSCTPVCDEQQQIQQIIHIATDITQLKQTEHRLQESRVELERRNQALTTLNQVTAAVSRSFSPDRILADALDQILELTRIDAGWVSMLDPSRKSLSLAVQRNLAPQMAGRLAEIEVSDTWIQALLRGDPAVTAAGAWRETWGLAPDSPPLLSCVPIQARNMLIGVLSLLSEDAHEMTAYESDLFAAVGYQIGAAVENIRLLQEASEIQILRELDRLRSELVANASHELRTPLGLIRLLSSALLMEDLEFDPETAHKFLSGIEEETVKLEQIVDNMLDLSRMEDGRLQLDRRPTDLGQLVHHTLQAMAPELAAHHLVCEMPPQPLVAVIDPARIEQVLRNLLSNAVKYSAPGTTIALGARRAGGEIVIDVRDRGIGIPAGEQSKIFERFYRVDNDATRRTRGAGLGLSICRWLVQTHGGQILVQSTPGAGSTFRVTLPQGEADTIDPGAPPTRREGEG